MFLQLTWLLLTTELRSHQKADFRTESPIGETLTNTLCKIQLLGGLRVQIGEREVTRFSTQKTASLLAYLAYHRHQQHPREVLMEALWPECDPKVGRNRLSVALSALRRQLEPPGIPQGSLIQADRFAVSLNPAAVTTDVAEFCAALHKAARATNLAERNQLLQHALSHCHSELLPGFYEDWVLTEQRRLEEMKEQAARFLAAHPISADSAETFFLPLSEPLPTLPERALTACDRRLSPAFTRFFGREDEIARLGELLRPGDAPLRLLTLTGAGGAGKTRLALAAARTLWECYPNSLWYAALADVTAARLPAAIADALELLRTDSLEPTEQIVGFLNAGNTPVLLILDNFEHIVEEGAAVVQTMLERVPALRCLVTSRRLLGLAHEREFPVPPLPTPRGADTPERLSLYDSVRLFVDRAQAVMPHFQVTVHNAPAVAELCDRLEGIPLALELAAARASVLTPSQMLDQLERRFDFLVSRKRDRPARHRTLRAAMDWSYHLLSPELQTFFARLSVFRGGWTWEAAEAVCEQSQALEYLEHLRECSLVMTEETDGTMRFRMLETIREFAWEQLIPEQRAEAQRRHADYFMAEAERLRDRQTELGDSVYYRALEANCENSLTALQWAKEQQGEPDRALRLVHALKPYWLHRGYFIEGQRHLMEALACDKTEELRPLRAWVIDDVSYLALKQNDFSKARDLIEWSIRNWRVLNPESREMAHALTRRGFVYESERDFAAAEAVYQESLALCETLGEKEVAAYTYNALGGLHSHQEKYEQARHYWERSLSLYRELGSNSNIATLLNNLGSIMMEQKNYEAALPLIEQSLTLHREMKATRSSAFTLGNLAMIKMGLKDYSAACELFEESLQLARQMDNKRLISAVLRFYGQALVRLGDTSAARAHYRESLLLSQEIGDEESVVLRFEVFGELAFTTGDLPRAVRLYSAAVTQGESIGLSVPDPHLLENYRPETMRLSLPEQEFNDAWETGRIMSWEEAIAYALEEESG